MARPSSERVAALTAMYTPPAPVSTYAGMSARERQFNDFIMNPLNWVGLGLVRAGVAKLATSSSRLGGAWRLSGRLKRPINTMYAEGFAFKEPSILAQRILSFRKKGNVLLLGYSALNPLENLHYARRGDWYRLIVNYHLPIIGVPIYSHLTSGSGAPTGRTPIRTTKPAKRAGTPLGRKPSWKMPKGKRTGSTGKRKGRPGTRYRSTCPPGHYWSKRYKKCVRFWKN